MSIAVWSCSPSLITHSVGHALSPPLSFSYNLNAKPLFLSSEVHTKVTQYYYCFSVYINNGFLLKSLQRSGENLSLLLMHLKPKDATTLLYCWK